MFILYSFPTKNEFLQVLGIIKLLTVLIFHYQGPCYISTFLLLGYLIILIYVLIAPAGNRMCMMLPPQKKTNIQKNKNPNCCI